jgi:hypothetical protein
VIFVAVDLLSGHAISSLGSNRVLGPLERKAIVASVCEQIAADADGLDEFVLREAWKDYVRAVVRPVAHEPLSSVPPPKLGHERKTGVKRAEVITAARSGRARMAPIG